MIESEIVKDMGQKLEEALGVSKSLQDPIKKMILALPQQDQIELLTDMLEDKVFFGSVQKSLKDFTKINGEDIFSFGMSDFNDAFDQDFVEFILKPYKNGKLFCNIQEEFSTFFGSAKDLEKIYIREQKSKDEKIITDFLRYLWDVKRNFKALLPSSKQASYTHSRLFRKVIRFMSEHSIILILDNNLDFTEENVQRNFTVINFSRIEKKFIKRVYLLRQISRIKKIGNWKLEIKDGTTHNKPIDLHFPISDENQKNYYNLIKAAYDSILNRQTGEKCYYCGVSKNNRLACPACRKLFEDLAKFTLKKEEAKCRTPQKRKKCIFATRKGLKKPEKQARIKFLLDKLEKEAKKVEKASPEVDFNNDKNAIHDAISEYALRITCVDFNHIN